jgi:hypothetical protein
MKILKYIIPAVVGVFACSCDKSLSEINVDPNSSTSANPPAMLTAAQGYYGIALDGYFNEQDALFAQYVAGGPGVALLDDERYFFEAGNYDNEWSFSYGQALSDLKFVMQNGNEAQAAAADILSVLIWQNLVDHFGNIPYSDALKGDPADGAILAPAYEDAQSIYNNLIERATASVAALQLTTDEIGAEDLIYGGDIDSWIRFGNSIKLKLLMRQSLTNAAVVGPQVVELISTGSFIEDETSLAAIPFSGPTGSNFNPQFARREAGIGQFYVASLATVDVLTDLNDPRAEVLYDVAENTGTIVGLKQGNVENEAQPQPQDFSYPSEVAYADDNDVILMSPWEVMFLRAEADMRFSTADDEKAMFDAAVTAHFDYIGAEGAAEYLANEVVYDAAASTQAKSDMIGIQKWIAMNALQESEGWIESRRFDMAPTNIFTNTATGIFYTPTRSVFGEGVFPTIRLYPQSELSYNANSPKGRVTTEKVFWDN